MANTYDFIKQYGRVSYNEKPFGDADNLVMCQISYLPFEKVVSESFDDEPKGFSEVCNDIYNYMGRRFKALGLLIPKDASVNLQEMSRQRRFAQMKVVACREVFETEPAALQFGTATFILPDGTLVIPFRGTDDTLTGWKEDLDILAKKGIPSHQLAVDYLEEAAKKFDGDIIICGHSKGGHVALYAALNCSEEVRSRIKFLYNNDGPGFCDYSLFDTEAYRELLPKYRHFIPHSSLVGVLLSHDDDYEVVRSDKLLGATQHDIKTWQIEDDVLDFRPELSMMGKITDLGIRNLVSSLSEEQIEAVERVVASVIKGSGQLSLTDFSKHLGAALSGAKYAWKNVEPEVKETFKEAFKGAGRVLLEAAKTVKDSAEPVVRKAAEFAERAMAN